jgi:ATP-dependent DNA helicase RecQ
MKDLPGSLDRLGSPTVRIGVLIVDPGGDGVVLSTVHSAMGLLLIGPWRLKGDRAHQEEERRAFYVGMTRARQTLAVIDRSDALPSLPRSLNGTVLRREFVPSTRENLHPTRLEYKIIGLDEIHVGYPGHFHGDSQIHRALAALKPGSILRMCLQRQEAIVLADDDGTAVARLSKKGVRIWSPHIHNIREVRVLALVHRNAEEEKDPVQRERCGVCEWEIPLVEVISARP